MAVGVRALSVGRSGWGCGVHIVLVEPEIHMNAGNVGRTCAVTGSTLHLVKPLGFSLADRYLKRAGLDYWPLIDLHVHDSWDEIVDLAPVDSMHLFTARSECSYTDVHYQPQDWLIFGRESVGLPQTLLDAFADRTRRIPMRPVTGARSLNLSNAVVIALYEALRQQEFPGLR